MSNQNSRVRLECDHEIWMKKPLPKKGDLVYCVKCDTYVNVGPNSARVTTTYYPDYDWESKPCKPNGYRGACKVENCGYTQSVAWDWYALRNAMVSHHLHTHADSSLLSDVKITAIPERIALTDPPF